MNHQKSEVEILKELDIFTQHQYLLESDGWNESKVKEGIVQIEDEADTGVPKAWSFSDGETFDKVTDTISKVGEGLRYLLAVKKQVEKELSQAVGYKVTMKGFSSYEALGEYD